MNLKQIFTWWHKQTLGTFLKTLFFGKFVGADSYGNKYYKSKNDQRWVVYKDNIEASKITSEWFLWCRFKSPLLVKEDPHSSHLNGFSPVWTSLCPSK